VVSSETLEPTHKETKGTSLEDYYYYLNFFELMEEDGKKRTNLYRLTTQESLEQFFYRSSTSLTKSYHFGIKAIVHLFAECMRIFQ
jgi:hypothetical protein